MTLPFPSLGAARPAKVDEGVVHLGVDRDGHGHVLDTQTGRPVVHAVDGTESVSTDLLDADRTFGDYLRFVEECAGWRFLADGLTPSGVTGEGL